MKHLLTVILMLGITVPMQASPWRSELRQWQQQVNHAADVEQIAQRQLVRAAKLSLPSILLEKTTLQPEIRVSSGNLYSRLRLTKGNPGSDVCGQVKEHFAQTNQYMRLLREWVDYLDDLLDSGLRCQSKVDHALEQINNLVQLTNDGYPLEYDDPSVLAVFQWNVVLPANSTKIGHFESRRTRWQIAFVNVESIELAKMKWTVAEAPVALETTHNSHTIEFSFPLSLTEACIGGLSPTIRGSIAATSTYKHNLSSELSEGAVKRDFFKEYSFAVTLSSAAD